MTELKELLSNEDTTDSSILINKAKEGDVNAYKHLIDLSYTAIKQSIELTEA